MPPPFRKHVFVCLNERPPDSPKGDCTRKGSPELLKKLKAALRARGLDEEIRANKAGCLDNCANGCSVVVLDHSDLHLPVPPRTLVLVRSFSPEVRGRADAALDPGLTDAASFRRALDEEDR